jgi:hypothetical protein
MLEESFERCRARMENGDVPTKTIDEVRILIFEKQQQLLALQSVWIKDVDSNRALQTHTRYLICHDALFEF